jgi:hypothetical protein
VDLNQAFCYETIQKIRSEDIFAGSFRFGSMQCAPAFKRYGLAVMSKKAFSFNRQIAANRHCFALKTGTELEPFNVKEI